LAPVAAVTRGFYNGFIHQEPLEQLRRRYMRSTALLVHLFIILFIHLSALKRFILYT